MTRFARHMHLQSRPDMPVSIAGAERTLREIWRLTPANLSLLMAITCMPATSMAAQDAAPGTDKRTRLEGRESAVRKESLAYPVRDSELKLLITGKRLTVNGFDGKLILSDTFFHNGRFVRTGLYAPVTGRYLVKGSSICIGERQGFNDCRKVVRSKSGRYFYRFTSPQLVDLPIRFSLLGD